MSAACPKCAHIRVATDEAPAWQCPKCGIAIAKYIELQKEAAQRKAVTPEPIHHEPVAFNFASSLLDDLGSMVGRKMMYWIARILVVGLVCYLVRPFNTTPPTHPVSPIVPMPVAQNTANQMPAPQVQTALPVVPGDPVLLTDSLKEEFETAHQQGEANVVILVKVTSRPIRGVDPLKPLRVHIERREALASSGCDRFGVTLTQGGGEHVNTREQMVKSAYSMHFVYSLNYCVDGTTPSGGRDIKVEAQQ